MTKFHNPAIVLILTTALLHIEYSGNDKKPFDNKWNGTVGFIESESGPDIISSESKIQGNFTNSIGPVIHSSKYQYKDGVGEIKRNCLANGEGRVEVIIDETKKTIQHYGTRCTGMCRKKY